MFECSLNSLPDLNVTANSAKRVKRSKAKQISYNERARWPTLTKSRCKRVMGWKPSYSSQFTIELNLLAARIEDR
jgi:hypothetical protein